jgi:hypothetical protein
METQTIGIERIGLRNPVTGKTTWGRGDVAGGLPDD